MPGPVDGVGRLPYAWSMDATGLRVEVVRLGQDRGIDFVEVHITGLWPVAPPEVFSITCDPPSAYPATNADVIRQRQTLARVTAVRHGWMQLLFGLDAYESGVKVWGSWSGSPVELMSGPRLRSYTRDWPIGVLSPVQPVDAVTPKLGLNMPVGVPIDATVRIGWNDCRRVP